MAFTRESDFDPYRNAVGNAVDPYRNAVAQSQAGTQTAPRELGVRERLSGVESGLHALVSMLETVAGRIDDSGAAALKGDGVPASNSLRPTLSRVESLLRRAHEIGRALDEAF